MRKHQDLSWSQLAMAANAPMLIKAALVDGDPTIGVLPTGQVTGVVRRVAGGGGARSTRIMAEARATLARLSGQAEGLRRDGSRRGRPTRTRSGPRRARGSTRTSPPGAPRTAAIIPSGDTRRRLRHPPRVGADAVRRPLGCRVVARGARRAWSVAVGVADLRGGVLPGRRAATGDPERHLPARADACSSSARRRSRRTSCARMAAAMTSGARVGASRTPAATWPR